MSSSNIKDYNKLMGEFPILFRDRNKPMTQTCMCWGIECGIGWYEPIYNLCCKLESLNEFFFKNNGFIVKADQVKEKYGCLTWYWSFDKASPGEWTDADSENWESPKYRHFRHACTSIVEHLISNAETDCFNTCEECGARIGFIWTPRYETVGWVKYICKDCYEKMKKDNPLLNAVFHFTEQELKEGKKYVSEEKYNELLKEIERQQKNLP